MFLLNCFLSGSGLNSAKWYGSRKSTHAGVAPTGDGNDWLRSACVAHVTAANALAYVLLSLVNTSANAL